MIVTFHDSHTLYALKSPGGWLMPETVAMTDRGCWTKSFDILYAGDPDFWSRYWKRVAESRRAARRKGYRVVKVHLVEST